jgi:hypothetical protein
VHSQGACGGSSGARVGDMWLETEMCGTPDFNIKCRLEMFWGANTFRGANMVLIAGRVLSGLWGVWLDNLVRIMVQGWWYL